MARKCGMTRRTSNSKPSCKAQFRATRRPSTGERSPSVYPAKASTRTRNSAKTGGIKRWRHYLLNSKEDRSWGPEENKQLLALHSVHLNKWKYIATLLPGRTGGQVKNQFFNIIRTLLRKAFKLTFKRSDSLVVSEIKPKVISDIVNRSVSSVAPGLPGPSDHRTVKDFLMDFVGGKNSVDKDSGRVREVLLAIKSLMKDTK